ncbi:hypothetical protein L6R29_23255 [Myxococcota bacterium]|nr:hypothetical protein [Myxococcota bacterium]
MSGFFSYPKISEDSQAWRLEASDWRRLQKQEWIATEKIHGANFCVVCDGRSVRFAKRKGFLEEYESFFGHERIHATISDAVVPMTWEIQEKQADATEVWVYGELYGGAYPHPDVPLEEGVQAVQTGVYYRPDIGFAVFDIAWLDRSQNLHFFHYDAMRKAADSAKMEAAPLLFRGRMEDGLALSPQFSTHIPQTRGLPALPWPNEAEGFVLRPADAIWIASPKGPIRPLLKRKHRAFEEDARYHQAQRWSAHPARLSRSEVVDIAFWEKRITELATPQRAQNAISKVGRPRTIDDPRRSQIEALLWEDILAVLREEEAARWDGLSAQTQRSLLMFLQAQSRTVLGNV